MQACAYRSLSGYNTAMSGTIEFSETNVWSAAGWIWRAVIRYLREEQPNVADLDQALINVDEDIQLWDLAGAHTAHLEALRRALKKIEERLIREGPKDWYEPTFFPGFMSRLGGLIQAVGTEIWTRVKQAKATP